MSVTEELDKKSRQLDEKLQLILSMFLLGKLSSQLAKALGAEAIEDAYEELIAVTRRQYNLTLQQLNTKTKRIKKVRDQIKQDFNNVVDREGVQISDKQLKKRTWLVALTFIYMLYAQSVVEIAIILKVPYIKWNNTIIPPWPCETCIGLKGLYRPHEVPPRPHPECRCFLSVIL